MGRTIDKVQMDYTVRSRKAIELYVQGLLEEAIDNPGQADDEGETVTLRV